MRRLTAAAVSIGDHALAAAAAFLAFRFIVIAAYLGAAAQGRLGAAEFAPLVAGPLAWAAGASAFLLLRRRRPRELRWSPAVFGAVVLALVLFPAQGATRANGLGLVSFAANGVLEQDYSRSGDRDDYPVCRFRYNSFGYRDEEPSFSPREGERRVLLVGDSYVWGDGIAANEETLPYLLRAELQRRAPGRFQVMSAAHPGLGLYGYARAIDELYARYGPEAVVVGYLGENDHDPLDPQVLLDHLPRRRALRSLLLNLGAPQHLHEASVRNFVPVWSGAGNKERFAALTRRLSRNAAERGYRLLLLSYFPHPPPPATIETFPLPEELRYPGRASDLWYAKNFHPKTKLNRILARTLAARLIEKEG